MRPGSTSTYRPDRHGGKTRAGTKARPRAILGQAPSSPGARPQFGGRPTVGAYAEETNAILRSWRC
jgi:hypothetical protein